MNQLSKTIITIYTTAITFGTFNLSAQAQSRWFGRGEIIEGDNKGALVKIEIQVDSNNVASIQSYPDAGAQIPLKLRTTTKTGTWEIYPCDEDLCATLEQKRPSRTIYYRLSPN